MLDGSSDSLRLVELAPLASLELASATPDRGRLANPAEGRARGVGAAGSACNGGIFSGINVKSRSASADSIDMQDVLKLANRYRISLDRAADQTFVGRCVELPGPTARGLSVDAVVKAVRAAAAAELMALPSKGRRAPGPLRDWN